MIKLLLVLVQAACVHRLWWQTEGKLAIVFTFFRQFFFNEKKADFRQFFLHGQRSVVEPRPTPSPWSILIGCCCVSLVYLCSSECNCVLQLSKYSNLLSCPTHSIVNCPAQTVHKYGVMLRVKDGSVRNYLGFNHVKLQGV